MVALATISLYFFLSELSNQQITAFSGSGLIEQLKFEGFSDEIATYAADEVGL
jgi:hypothetical protein